MERQQSKGWRRGEARRGEARGVPGLREQRDSYATMPPSVASYPFIIFVTVCALDLSGHPSSPSGSESS